MIIDKIENIDIYKALGSNFAKAFDILKEMDFEALESGKHEVDGDNLFFMVSRYDTLDIEKCPLEAHKKYVDIQYLVSGEEIFGYSPISDELEITEPYNSQEDYALYAASENDLRIHFKPGMVIVAFPEDAHMPCAAVTTPETVLKVVFKVKIND